MKVTFLMQEEALAWAAEKVELDGKWSPESQAAAVVDEEGTIHCVVVYNAFYGDQCTVHIASDSAKNWASRDVLRTLFAYPFNALGLNRLTGYTPSRNEAALALVAKLGFTLEGRQRKAAPDGDDLVMNGMLREECRWIRGRAPSHGQEKRTEG